MSLSETLFSSLARNPLPKVRIACPPTIRRCVPSGAISMWHNSMSAPLRRSASHWAKIFLLMPLWAENPWKTTNSPFMLLSFFAGQEPSCEPFQVVFAAQVHIKEPSP